MTECVISPESNRTCERGTPKCEIHHTDAAADSPVGTIWRSWRTKYLYEFLMTALDTDSRRSVVVYRSQLSQMVYTMPSDEFHQRFEPV